jgi:hypothetical protein
MSAIQLPLPTPAPPTPTGCLSGIRDRKLLEGKETGLCHDARTSGSLSRHHLGQETTMKHHAPLIGATLAVGVGLALAAPGYAGTTTHPTQFAFHSSGYGSRVIGGQLPAGSGTSAYQAIGCTSKAGVTHANDVADVTVPGLGTLSGVATRVWTTQRHGVTTSHSTHTIASLTVAQSGLGTLTIDAITSKARAFHDGSGFHAATATDLGGITFTPPVGPSQTFPAPTPSQPVEVPGLATISLGRSVTSRGTHGSRADALALSIHVVPTDTSVKVAHAHADLHGGMTYGAFHGHSNATRVVHALTTLAHSGPNPLTIMPCQGTYGSVRRKALAHLDLGGLLVVRGLASQDRAAQTLHGAHGYEQATVARVDLGHGQLVVKGIVGRAHVTRTRDGVVTSARGTQLGTITANGTPQTFPRTGVITIPGVVKLQRRVVDRTATGIRVVALRITLLDGSGAVINLGEATLHISRLSH